MEGRWVFCGLAFGKYRKDPKLYSKQLNCGLLFPKLFRGYGLAKLLTIISLYASRKKFDVIFEEATVRNDAVHNLVERLGFKRYGVLKNLYYTFKEDFEKVGFKENRDPLESVGLIRTYSFMGDILDIFSDVMEPKFQKQTAFLSHYEKNDP